MGLTAYEYIKTEKEIWTYPEGDNGPVIPFGIPHLDYEFIMGQKPWSPQLNVLQGGPGSRKTTMMIRFLISQLTCGNYPPKLKTNIYTLESGVSVEGYILRMRQQIATMLMIYEYYSGERRDKHPDKTATEYFWWLINRHEFLPLKPTANLISDVRYTPQNSNTSYMLCVLAGDFIESVYNGITTFLKPQFDAWLLAGEIVARFKLEVYGTSEHHDMEVANQRSMNTVRLENLQEHWGQQKQAADERGYKIQIIIDFFQEIALKGANDFYTKQLEITPYISDWIKENKSTAWVLSQEGTEQQKAFVVGNKVYGSAGGNILQAASQNNWRVSYDENKNPFELLLHRPVKSRRGSHPDLKLMIEPKSGAIFGDSKEYG